MSIIGFTGSARHWSAPFTESVAAHSDGGPVIGILPNGNPRVTREERPPSKQPIRIRCNECDGQGIYTLSNSMDPYARTYDCEGCDGTGFLEVEDEEALA